MKSKSASAAIVVLLILILAPPNISRLIHWHPTWEEKALSWKIEHPLSAIPAATFVPADSKEPAPVIRGISSHLQKRTYRITIPLIAHLLRLDIRGAELLCIFLSLCFPVVVLLCLRKATDSPLLALLLAISLGCSFVGEGSLQLPSFFDAAGYVVLALCVYAERPLFISLLVVLGGFSDERVILAVPVVYLLYGDDFELNRRRAGLLAGIAAFGFLRLIFGFHVGRQFDVSVINRYLLIYNSVLLPVQLPLVYKGALLATGVGYFRLLKANRPMAVALFFCTLPGLLASLPIGDVCRSLSYTFPTFIACGIALAKYSEPKIAMRYALASALLSVITPTYYLWIYGYERIPAIWALT